LKRLPLFTISDDLHFEHFKETIFVLPPFKKRRKKGYLSLSHVNWTVSFPTYFYKPREQKITMEIRWGKIEYEPSRIDKESGRFIVRTDDSEPLLRDLERVGRTPKYLRPDGGRAVQRKREDIESHAREKYGDVGDLIIVPSSAIGANRAHYDIYKARS